MYVCIYIYIYIYIYICMCMLYICIYIYIYIYIMYIYIVLSYIIHMPPPSGAANFPELRDLRRPSNPASPATRERRIADNAVAEADFEDGMR